MLFDVLQTTGVRVWICWLRLGILWRVCGVYTGLVSGRFLGRGVWVKPVGVDWLGKNVYHV